MNNTPPLYNNNTKKLAFISAVLASTYFNIDLFSSIGETILTRVIWATVGVSAVFFQTVKLKEFFNTTKNIKYLHLSFYIICTIGSVAGTLGAGYSNIEKTKLKNISQIYKLEIIDKKINDFENKEIDNTHIAINNLMKNNTNVNEWALINIINKKNKLKISKKIEYDILENLKNERAIILKSQSGVISSLTGLSKLFNVNEEMTAFIFLIFVSIILEMIIYGSATYSGALFIVRKKKVVGTSRKKVKDKGQLYLIK